MSKFKNFIFAKIFDFKFSHRRESTRRGKFYRRGGVRRRRASLVYVSKCKQVNIPPLSFRFNFNDMNLFHKIVYKTIPVNIPDYLTLYSGDSRLRQTHLDNLSFVSNIASTTTSIKSKLAKHFWSIAGPDNEQPEHEWSFQSSDEGS